MAIDQRDVSSKLRFMDDRALQQYAAMHKNDPYIFPLAFQESQNRQKLRMQQQAQAGAQPQPKVADQALAQMMPEEQGIATLPAQNMQGMADGGIAGYEGYDEEPQQFGQEPVLRMAEGGHVPRYQGNPRDGSLVRMPYDQPPASITGEIPGFVAGSGNFQQQPGVAEEEPFFRRVLREFQESVEAKRVQEARVRAAKGQPLSAEDQARIAKADSTKAAAGPSAQDMAQFDAASNLYMTERAAKQAADKPASAADKPAPAADNKAAPKADTTRKPAPSKNPASAATPAVPEQSAAQRYADLQKDMGLGPEAGADVEWKRSQLTERMRAQSKGELEDFDKETAARGEAFKGREARLAKREAGLEKQKDENTGLALLEAGLSIMSTPGSLATAIGKGAQTGLKTYSAGLKDLRAAQEKMDDARDQIEEFRRNEANMTAKERRQFKSAINKTETEIERLGVDAAEKMYGYKREDAKSVFAATTQERLTKQEIDAKKEIAREDRISADARSAAQIKATLNTPDRIVFDQLLKRNDNDAVKAAEALQKLKAEKFNMYEAYSKYLAGFAGKENLMKGPDDFDVFAKRFIPTVTPGKNTTVRTQPGE
jgi:hypothetical protein